MNKVRFYKSDNLIRDIGVIYFYNFLKNYGFKVELHKNYLEFDYLDSKIISKLITEDVLFEIFKNGNKKEFIDEKNSQKSIFTKEEYDEVTFDNFILKLTKKLKFEEKKLEKYKKDFYNIRFPYMRNSSKYGINGNGNTFKRLQLNVEKLFNLVQHYYLGLEDLSAYKVSDNKCEVCNINKTTELDFTLEKRVDSKYIFTFKGAVSNGFKNNGEDVGSHICFECEFLNLCALIYLNLKRVKNIVFINNLIDMNNINQILSIHKNNFGDRELLKYLGKLSSKDILIYKTIIDTKKGIILDLSKVVEVKYLIKEIKLLDLIKNMEIDRDSNIKKEKVKKFVYNKNLNAIDRWFLFNIGQKGDIAGRIDNLKTINNLRQYNAFLELGGKKLSIIKGLKEFGIELSNHMNEAEKSKFFYSCSRYMKLKNRYDLQSLIIDKAKKYKLQNILDSTKLDYLFSDDDYDQIKRNINILLLEAIKERKGGKQYEQKKD